MTSRWEHLLEQKPVPLTEHLLEEMSKRLSHHLSQWPPPVESWDEDAARPLAQALEPGRSPPAPAVYREAFRLARWELERDLAAFDDYMRNRRWAAHGLAPDDKPTLLLLCRWLVEQLLTLAESTEGRLKRPALLDCLERTERRYFAH